MKIKNIIAIILVLSFLLAVFSSCQEVGALVDEFAGKNSSEISEEIPEEEKEFVDDGLLVYGDDESETETETETESETETEESSIIEDENLSEESSKDFSDEPSKIEIAGDVFRKPKEESPFIENSSSSEVSEENIPQTTERVKNENEIIGVWLAYLDYVNLIQDKNENDAKISIDNAFQKLKEDGFNTVYLQIRPFSDAIYASNIFPWSHILNSDGIQGKDPGYDPLKLMLDIAKMKNLSMHAWINPYRVSINSHPKTPSDKNILNHSSLSEKDFIDYNNGKYINPASKNGQKLVIDGITEVLSNYFFDGVQFDDYFYPTQDESIDKEFFENYQAEGGQMSLANWRRENVNTLVSNVYKTIKDIDRSIVFGISPEANIEKNYTMYYADIEKWVTEDGYLDYILPQIYFGFSHATLSFSQNAKSWNDLAAKSNKELIIGIAAYKIGLEDPYAGENAKNEWKDNSDLMKKQYEESVLLSQYNGVCLFRLDSIYTPSANVSAQVAKEFDAFKEAIK